MHSIRIEYQHMITNQDQDIDKWQPDSTAGVHTDGNWAKE